VNSKPFFLLADTAWELLHRLTFEEIEYYFRLRKSQGFNSAQTVIISEMDGLRIPNVQGELPLHDMNPEKPNDAFFKYLDEVISLADRYNFYLTLVPVWGDKVDRMFGLGPEILNVKNAFAYGQWLGKRYVNTPNIIWMNGGDRSGGGKNYPVWNALAEGIRSEDAGHLMTFHPLGDASSSMWFHDAPWLDFNSCQSGHSMRDYPNHMMISYDYLRKPAKPCIDSESRYEEHAVNWKPETNGLFDDYDVRQAAYWSVFAGACGHTYGAHPVWQMYDGKRESIGYVRNTWKEALKLPGAGQLVHMKNLLLSRPYFERIPDQSPLISPKAGDEHIRCTRGRGYLFCYLPRGGETELDISCISGKTKKVWWYDPRNGQAESLGNFPHEKTVNFIAPSSGRGSDWVLVVDDSSLNMNKPGEITESYL
jgi:hypothetical protein